MLCGAWLVTAAPMHDRELINATRPFAEESAWLSTFHVVTSFALLFSLLAGAALLPSLPARLLCSIFAGFTTVRVFILYHDHLHGSLLRKSKWAKGILSLFGVWVMAPPSVWKQTHNYHHAHTAQIIGSHVGSYPMMTVDMWHRATFVQRTMYRMARHPLNIALGYFTIFAFGMCVASFLRSPKRCWDSLVALMAQVAVVAALWTYFGWQTAVLVNVLPLMVACASGSYLFYAQHNFPELSLAPREEWTFTKAALESSSYMKTGPIVAFFTGNIGYHHVHHLNPSIPFYRLPEAMRAIPELQYPRVTTLHPKDVWAGFRLKLWDPASGRMVPYPPRHDANPRDSRRSGLRSAGAMD